MRKSKIITLDSVGEITIKEVSPLALYQALTQNDKVESLLVLAEECTGLRKDALVALYASDWEQLINAAKEVNSSFLAIAGHLGIKDFSMVKTLLQPAMGKVTEILLVVLEAIKTEITIDLQKKLSGQSLVSPPAATEPPSGTMAGSAS